jgi:hypothetical protein
MAGLSGSLKDEIEAKKKRSKSTCEICGVHCGYSRRPARACKYSTKITLMFYVKLPPTATATETIA